MQTSQRNDDVRRYTRRTSRAQPTISTPSTVTSGEERLSPSKQTKSTIGGTKPATRRLSSGETNPASSASSSALPPKANSAHETISPSRQSAMATISSPSPSGRRTSSTSLHSRSSTSTAATFSEERNSTNKASKRPGTVSPFLKNTHRELKKQIATLQGHIKFIQELATLNDEKRIDLLFQMIDRDGGGTVDAEELAAAMRRNDELSFSDSIEKAIDMVALFDKDGNLNMDKHEFREYVAAMVKELGVSVPDFTEFLIVQLLLSEETDEEKKAGEMARDHINEEVKKRQELMIVLASEFISEAYEMFDEDNVGQVPFKTVAKALHQSTKNERRAAQKALSVLLMIDANDTRMLSYELFGKLIISVSKATGKSFDETADDLMCTLESSANFTDETTMNSQSSNSETKKDYIDKVDDLTNRRLLQLFHLWDEDGSGDISREELADGLDKFQRASGINVDANALAQALVVGFTEDKKGSVQQLGVKEFAQAMVLYAEQFGVEIHSLIDFMVSTTGSSSSPQSSSSSLRNGSHKNSSSRRASGTNSKKSSSTAGGSRREYSNESAEVDFWEDF